MLSDFGTMARFSVKFKSGRKGWKARRGRKFGKRKGGKSFKKRVLAVMQQQVETKKYPGSGNFAVAKDTMVWACPYAGIIAGLSSTQRIGDTIRLVGLKYTFHVQPQTEAIARGDCRFRFVLARGAAVGRGPGTVAFSATTGPYADGFFGATRAGVEELNGDWAKYLMSKEFSLKCTDYTQFLTSQSAGQITQNLAATAGTIADVTNTYSAVFNAKKWSFYMPLKGQKVTWRGSTADDFKELLPIPHFWAWNDGVAAGTLVGQVYWSLRVYFKDA
jgi:hypothetical protein